MWRSEQGDVVLTGAVGDLFSDVLWGMAEQLIDLPEPIETGVAAFDRLSAGQQMAALHIVGPAALRKDVPAPELTAVVEGAFAAVFAHYLVYIAEDVDDDPEDEINPFVLAVNAARERGIWDEDTDRSEMSTSQWVVLLRDLASTYMWDADYELGDHLADLPPEASQQVRDEMTIHDTYFSWVPEDYTEDQMEAAAQELVDMCRSGG